MGENPKVKIIILDGPSEEDFSRLVKESDNVEFVVSENVCKEFVNSDINRITLTKQFDVLCTVSRPQESLPMNIEVLSSRLGRMVGNYDPSNKTGELYFP